MGYKTTRVWDIDNNLVAADTIEDAVALWREKRSRYFLSDEPETVTAIGTYKTCDTDYDCLIKCDQQECEQSVCERNENTENDQQSKLIDDIRCEMKSAGMQHGRLTVVFDNDDQINRDYKKGDVGFVDGYLTDSNGVPCAVVIIAGKRNPIVVPVYSLYVQF